MSLNPAQFNALKSAIIADATAGPMRTGGNTSGLLAWCNAATTTKAWKTAVSRLDIFNALTIATYDNVSPGKRDALRMMMDNAPVDAAKTAANDTIRAGFVDIFAVTASYTDATQLPKMLNNACIEFATKAQEIIGGSTPAAIGAVVALRRNFIDAVSQAEADLLVN